MNNLSLEELQQFSYKLAAPAVVTLILNIFGFTTFGLIISVIIHIIVLGIFFLLFKEFKSAFLKLILLGLVLCLVGEILIFFNLEHTKYENVYWAFLGIHFIRNLILGVAYGWNVIKSHLFNPLWTKLLPFIVVVPIFLILQAFLFSNEEEYTFLFLIYNASICFMLVTAGLRYNHTSDRCYVMMLIAVAAFLLSEIFYFLEFDSGSNDTKTAPTNTAGEILAEEDDWDIIAAFRAPLLQVGSCLLVSATVEHVIHFKLTVKQRIYLPLTEKETSVLRGRVTPTVATNIVNVGKKKMQEPLI